MVGVTEVIGLLKLVDGVLRIMRAIPEVKAEADALRAQLRMFIAEGRSPTAKEWNDLNASLDASMKILEDRLAG